MSEVAAVRARPETARGLPAKAAILNHGYIPHYRVRFYELLAEQGRVDYTVFHGAPPSWIGVDEIKGPFAFGERRVRNREIRVGPLTLVYQPVIREILTGGYDAVVITTEAKFVSNILLALLAKIRGVAVIYWGFGYHPKRGFNDSDRARPLLLAAATFVKNRLMRLADGYLAYTRLGAAQLTDGGFPAERTFFVQNTIDMDRQFRLHERVAAAEPQEIRRSLGLQPDSVVLVFIGRLVQFKRVDQLIDVVRRINRDRLTTRRVETLIIGSGPLEAELKAGAADAPEVHFLGALPADEQVARCLKISAAAVVCGIVGLMVNHALAHGRPVIARVLDSHSPELEYLDHDRNGLIVPGDLDAFAAELARFIDSPEWQARLAAGALDSRKCLRMEVMASRFDDAVAATVARRPRAPTASGGAFVTVGDRHAGGTARRPRQMSQRQLCVPLFGSKIRRYAICESAERRPDGPELYRRMHPREQRNALVPAEAVAAEPPQRVLSTSGP